MTEALIAVAILVLLLVLAGTILFAGRRRRRREALAKLPRRAPPRRAPELPIVLAHGFLGFDELALAGARHEYFRGIAAGLRIAGATVLAFPVAPVASIARRAQGLADALAKIPERRVHIVAHSMGGLDARYAITRLGLAPRVRSLITIGTPHRGTPLGDVGNLVLGGWMGLHRLWEPLAVSGVIDVGTARMQRFNEEVPDVPGVFYGSVVAGVEGATSLLSPLLVPTYWLLRQTAGDNDGVVPTSSQIWGTVVAEIRADHWGQIGWSSGFRALDLYLAVAARLRELEEIAEAA